MKREIANNAPKQIEANGDGGESKSAGPSADVPATQPQAGDGA